MRIRKGREERHESGGNERKNDKWDEGEKRGMMEEMGEKGREAEEVCLNVFMIYLVMLKWSV